MNERLTLSTTGHLSIGHEFADGSTLKVAECHNALQKVGCGTVARCLSTPGSAINTMYLLYTNGAIPTITGVDDGEVTLTDLTDADATINFYRVPVVHVATASTDTLGANIVTFHGVTGGNAAGTGAAFDTGSRVYVAALVCSVDGNLENDLLFSVAKIQNDIETGDGIETVYGIAKVANAQLGIRWQVTVNYA